MNKKLKSLSLSLGALASVITPVVAAVSCGSSSNNHVRPHVGKADGKTAESKVEQVNVGNDYKEVNKDLDFAGTGWDTDYESVSKDGTQAGQTFSNFQNYRTARDHRIETLQQELSSEAVKTPVQVAQSIVKRYIGDRVNDFTFSLIAKELKDGPQNPIVKDSAVMEKHEVNKYTIEVKDNHQVHIEGSSAVAMARGWYDWMKRNGYGMIGWQSNSIHLPAKTEFKVSAKVSVVSPYERHYFGNSAAAGYSSPWWNANDWANWLSWCAVHGYDLMLDYVGHEQILTKLYMEIGYTKDDVREYLSGPAYATWSRLGNIANWDSIPDNKTFDLWNERKKDVQHSIKGMMDKMDIKGIPASFAGFVPEVQNGVTHSIEEFFGAAAPNYNNPTHTSAHTQQTKWTSEDRHHNHILNPDWIPTGVNPLKDSMAKDSKSTGYDSSVSLFENMSKRYVELYQQEYGQSDYYLADAFEEMFVPKGTNKPDYFNKVGNALYRGIEAATKNNTNGSAVFAFQGWNLGFQRGDWNPDSLEGFLKDIPDNKVFIIDQAEDYNEWSWHNNANFKYYKKSTFGGGESFGGKKWVYCTIPNMGGNTAVTGNLEWYGTAGPDALKTAKHGYLFAYGSAPEGIDTNPVTQELISDMGWRTEAIDIKNGTLEGYVGNNWLANYDINRYGFESKKLREYWLRRLATANSYLDDHPIHKWQLKGWATWTAPDSDGWLEALRTFKTVASERKDLKNTPLFRDDLLRFTNIYLGIILDRKLSDFEAASTVAEKRKLKAEIDPLFDKMDKLTVTHNTDRLSRWLKMAKWWGDEDKAPGSTNYFERDAKYHVTLWYPSLEDYAAKHWGGLINYYKKKMDTLMERSITGAQLTPQEIEASKNMDRDWITDEVALPYVSLPWIYTPLTDTELNPTSFDSPYTEAMNAVDRYSSTNKRGLKPASYSTLMSNPYQQNLTDIKTEFQVTTEQLQHLKSLTIFSKVVQDPNSLGQNEFRGNPIVDNIEIIAGTGIIWKHRHIFAKLDESKGNADALTFNLEGLSPEVAQNSNNGAKIRITWRSTVFTNAKLQLFLNDTPDKNDPDHVINGAKTYRTFNNGQVLNNELRDNAGTMHFAHGWATDFIGNSFNQNAWTGSTPWTGENELTLHLGLNGIRNSLPLGNTLGDAEHPLGNIADGFAQFIDADIMDEHPEVKPTISIKEDDGSFTTLTKSEKGEFVAEHSTEFDRLNHVHKYTEQMKWTHVTVQQAITRIAMYGITGFTVENHATHIERNVGNFAQVLNRFHLTLTAPKFTLDELKQDFVFKIEKQGYESKEITMHVTADDKQTVELTAQQMVAKYINADGTWNVDLAYHDGFVIKQLMFWGNNLQAPGNEKFQEDQFIVQANKAKYVTADVVYGFYKADNGWINWRNVPFQVTVTYKGDLTPPPAPVLPMNVPQQNNPPAQGEHVEQKAPPQAAPKPAVPNPVV